MAVNLLVGAVAMVLGAFVTASPTRAAKIWGSKRLEEVAPQDRVHLFRWYRVFGLLLGLAGVLVVIDSIVFSEYQ